MAPTKPPRRNTRGISHHKTQAPADLEGVWARTHRLVETLLETLSKGIESPDTIPDHWERLFGAKDSVVVSLQKLVALLIELRHHLTPLAAQGGEERTTPLEAHELELLEAWMKGQGRSGQGGHPPGTQ